MHHAYRINLIVMLNLVGIGLSFGQDASIYFDKQWLKCGESEAAYFRKLEVNDSVIFVNDYYRKGGIQCTGTVRNTENALETLQQEGDFDLLNLGEMRYFKKNGDLDYTEHFTPFDPNYGVDSMAMSLLSAEDTIGIDQNQLTFVHVNFKKLTIDGWLLNGDLEHGTWIRSDKKTTILINKSHNLKGKLEGSSSDYYRKTGSIHHSYSYSNNQQNGEQKIYNRKGRLVKSKEYKNGVLIDTWLYQKPTKKKN